MNQGCIAAYPYKEGIGSAKRECEICHRAVSIEPANLPTIAARSLSIICVTCLVLMSALSREEIEFRGRMKGGQPIDEIAQERAQKN